MGKVRLGYQMMNAPKSIFRPGHSFHEDKRHGRVQYVRGIQTMRCMVTDVFQFADFLRSRREVRDLREVTPEMAQRFVQTLVERGDSGGRIARVSSSLRKLDVACRHTGVFAQDAPDLLPYAAAPGPPVSTPSRGRMPTPRQMPIALSPGYLSPTVKSGSFCSLCGSPVSACRRQPTCGELTLIPLR